MPRARLRRRRARREEGAVMLIVMLILMVATATAAVSVHSTQYELQAAGHARQALQTKYVSEAVATTTVAWFDKVFDPNIGGGFSQFYQNCVASQGAGEGMHYFGQPDRPDGAAYDVCRLSRASMEPIQPHGPTERFPVRAAAGPNDPTPQVGEPPLDPLGTTGPRQAYQPEEDFISDLMCRSSEIDKPGGSKARQYRCAVTARGRLFRKNADPLTNPATAPDVAKSWTIGTGQNAATYQQNAFSTYHESRLVVLTEEVIPGT